MSWCPPASRMLRAGVAQVEGDPAAAMAHLREAVPGFERADMAMHAAAARRQLGRLLGGDEGAKLIAAAEAWMAREEVVRPDRFVAMLAPGFDAPSC